MKSQDKVSHVAFIMDGNLRWSKKNSFSAKIGYKKGLEKLKEVCDICLKNNIQFVTAYSLSTENIKRDNINIIYDLIFDQSTDIINYFINNHSIKVNIIGDKNYIPTKILEIFNNIENKTSNNKIMQLNLAFNYGSWNEIEECIKKIIDIYKENNNLKINEKLIRDHLYTTMIPDPDILIRTGGFIRLSNFLLLQLKYTELFFTNTLWPDFNEIEFNEIINKYMKIERKYGR